MRRIFIIATVFACIHLTHGQSTIAYFTGPVSSVPGFPATGPIDLNVDGEPDLNFTFGSTLCTADVPTSACMTPFYLGATSSNQVTVSGNNVWLFPAGTLIGVAGVTNGNWGPPGSSALITTLFWNYDRFIETSSMRWTDPLASQSDSYLGIRFHAADGVHYGWIHVTLHGSPLLVDWAYETRPNTAIVAGAKPVAVPQASPEIVRPGYLRLRWQSGVGKPYQPQFKESLGATLWSNLDFVIIATATNSAVDVPAVGAIRFYRVVEAD